MLDFTIHRCNRNECERVARWNREFDNSWWCKDHRPGSAVYVVPDKLPDPPEMEGEMIGQLSLRLRVKR